MKKFYTKIIWETLNTRKIVSLSSEATTDRQTDIIILDYMVILESSPKFQTFILIQSQENQISGLYRVLALEHK